MIGDPILKIHVEGKKLKTFEELDLIAPVQRALRDENYETPTPIQAQTIPDAIQGRDVLGCAQTGTGKTAAFALPILNRLGKRNRKATPNRPDVLVLAPTRELAIQIGDSFSVYGRHLRLRQALVYGGVGQGSQVRALDRGAHILVATPGRLLDLMNQGHVILDQLQVFVLDEADRMLDMGFLPDLKRIISQLPNKRQSLFFSATLPPNIIELSKRLLRDPAIVKPKTESREKIQKQIEQWVLFLQKGEKQKMLRQILAGDGVHRTIVFTRTKRGANLVTEKLAKSGIKAAAIHGNKSQGARQRALSAFRNNQVHVLVATDVAARGIDIDGITHVVNFDLPNEPESYVHRIGRTGRAGAAGTALSFCCPNEQPELRAIERLIGQKVPVRGGRPAADPGDQGTRPARGSATGNRKKTVPQRSGARKRVRQDNSDRCPSDASGEQGKPKRRRSRRKSPPPWQRAKQSS